MTDPDVRIEKRAAGGWLFRPLNTRATKALENDLFDWYVPGPWEGGALVVTGGSYASCRVAVTDAGFIVEDV